MEEPTVEPGQIAYDRYYFETNKASQSASAGTVSFVLHDLKTLGKAKSSDRWYRVWRKIDQGWVFDRLQFGRFSHRR